MKVILRSFIMTYYDDTITWWYSWNTYHHHTLTLFPWAWQSYHQSWGSMTYIKRSRIHQGIPTVIIMAEYFKTLGPSKCSTIYTMVSWARLVLLICCGCFFSSYFRNDWSTWGIWNSCHWTSSINSWTQKNSLIWGIFIECQKPRDFNGQPHWGSHLHGAHRQLHVAGGISALGSTGQGLSLCDLRRIYGWHWSRGDAQMPSPEFAGEPDRDFIHFILPLSSLYPVYIQFISNLYPIHIQFIFSFYRCNTWGIPVAPMTSDNLPHVNWAHRHRTELRWADVEVLLQYALNLMTPGFVSG